ncbi:beta-2-microglobulin [Labrus bergylta]|uniref:Beta-2-microglobulin n=1 Tax=Labrus bergylta TaxID=56723 RepID=A0A3Q3GV75_9LABR|nr:beta-2-microglobulin-like [Labrus bergylta]
MKLFLSLFVLVAVCSAQQKHTHPKVQVYSSARGEFGNKNTLICHVSGFYPPDLTITLLKGDKELAGCNQTDLAFNKNWHFHLTRSVDFSPTTGDEYTCRVQHGSNIHNYAWEPNM